MGLLLDALNIGTPDQRDNISLGLQNLAHFDSGGIDMQQARANLQQQKYQQQQRTTADNQKNQTVAWLQKTRPDLVPLIDAGMSPADVMTMAYKDAHPAPMTMSPGETLGMPTADGGFKATYTAPTKTDGDLSKTVAGRTQLADAYGLKGQDAISYKLTGKLPGGNSSMKYGNTPIPVRDANGNYLAVQPGSDGSTNVMKLPDGYKYDPGALNSDRAAGSAYGQAQGGAQFNLPAAKQNVEAELGNIDSLSSDQKGIDETFGKVAGIWPQQWAPTIPGTAKADYSAKLDQVTGQNFLQAYASLKGAGAITEVEGGKAQDAMARLSKAQSKEAYLKALGDLKEVLATGYQRMAGQAASGPYQSSGYQPPALNAGPVDMGGGVTIRQVQ